MIGLTGAAGAGKSTVASILASLGCAVIDVDRLGHAALDAPEVVAEVRRVFGDHVLAAGARVRDGFASLSSSANGGTDHVDRTALAAAAFSDPVRLKHLEAIVHPWVMRRLQIELAKYHRNARSVSAPRAVVVDCALLFESSLDRFCDTTVVVTAPRSVRARRVRRSRGWSSEQLRRREAAQFPAAEKRLRADHVLPNGEDVNDAGGRGSPALRRAAAQLLRVVTRGSAPPAQPSSTRAAKTRVGPGTPGARTNVRPKQAGSNPAKRKSR
ncbi:MAG: dephospho-CoA kinase [Planctomycetes bacterium]|nr:dephospho-CoA kinase [Planctomycetota bacterium]